MLYLDVATESDPHRLFVKPAGHRPSRTVLRDRLQFLHVTKRYVLLYASKENRRRQHSPAKKNRGCLLRIAAPMLSELIDLRPMGEARKQSYWGLFY
jgi:hypothetical protein